MAKQSASYLLKLATEALQKDGLTFKKQGRWDEKFSSKNVLIMTEAGVPKKVLIQTRSESDSNRILIGVIYIALSRVDEVIFWAEDEPHYYRIPAKMLNELYIEMKEDNTARYSGDRIWRINVHFDRHLLSPQLPPSEPYNADQRGYERPIGSCAKTNRGFRK